MHKTIGTIYRYLPPFTLVLHNCSRKYLYLIWSLKINCVTLYFSNHKSAGGWWGVKTSCCICVQPTPIQGSEGHVLPPRPLVREWLAPGLLRPTKVRFPHAYVTLRGWSAGLLSTSAPSSAHFWLAAYEGGGGWSLFSAAQILECEFAPPCYRGGPHLGQLLRFFLPGWFFPLIFRFFI